MEVTHIPFFSRQYRPLRQLLAAAMQNHGLQVYLTGGTVRDLLLGRPCQDIDLTMSSAAVQTAKQLAASLGASFILLDEEEEVARIVWRQATIDFARFREGTISIEADLAKRDFTMNALAIALHPTRDETGHDLRSDDQIIDPCGGAQDLESGIIRCTGSEQFISDPLRLLRAYRFMAVLDFSVESETAAAIRRHAGRIHEVAGERLQYELNLIMSAPRAFSAVQALYDVGLLGKLFPELMRGVGMDQPDSHHLDVFHHCLATLGAMEKIEQDPGRYFPGYGQTMREYLASAERSTLLKWAALFHDLGKPATYRRRKDKKDRITFYGHDLAGSEYFRDIAGRLKWSREDMRRVSRLIELHMWPFHLNNVRRRAVITPRAALKLVKTAGAELNGLFLLAMADCLAGKGEGRPQALEKSLAVLYKEIIELYQRRIKSVLEKPGLLNGHDLQEIFELKPGPVFRTILDDLQQAQAAGEIVGREDAIAWVRDYLRQRKTD
jgi:poly(A) polymerase